MNVPTRMLARHGISPFWSNVDRPHAFGWIVTSRALAERLRAAVLAGVVLTDPKIKTDTGGQTYVEHKTHVLGRRMNADLRRLGF